ncbi:MAG: hypothetical protein ACT4O9_15080 [Blastocatellia bacterium]
MAQAAGCHGSTPIDDPSIPNVRFVGLRQYSRAFSHVPLGVRAGDDVGITRIELFIDQVLHSSQNVSSLRDVLVYFNWNTITSGKHVLQTKAYDAAGNSQTSTLIVFSRTLTPPTGNTITLNPAVRHQVMQGWEATDQAAQSYSPAWNNYKNQLMDQAVNDLGINRIRLEIASGIESTTDFFAQWRAGQITESQYVASRYQIVNDDANPNTINPNGFKWSQLNSSMNEIVLPMRQRLQARGESLWISINYVDFGSSAFEHKNSPAEYAELVLATYQHMQSTYGVVPNSWEVVLEPDTASASWSATQVAQAIKAAGDRLVANNFTPNFVAPSPTDAAQTTIYIDQIAATPGAMQHVGEFAYHRYAGGTPAILNSIANRTVLYNKKAAMLEWIGADYDTLHEDIKVGLNSSWQQYCLAGPTSWGPDSGDRYYIVDDTVPANPVLTMGSRTKFLRQYFRFVRAGAQRIEARTGNSNFDPLAFINTNGKYVVVVKAANAGSFSIQNLPTGTYGIKYTTGALYDVDLPDVIISTGQALATNIPNPGVITVYAR